MADIVSFQSRAKVKLHFLTLPIPQKIEYARDRVIDMTGNANFPTPDVPLNTITDNATDLEQKYNAAQGGGPAQTAAQDAAEITLDNNMRILANYVTRIAAGSVVIITSAGFTPTQTELTPAPVPAKPQNIILKHGVQAGTITTQCDKVEFAKGYITIVATSATPPVTVNGNMIVINEPVSPASALFMVFEASTNRKTVITGLNSGTRYYVHKYAFNAAGKGPDSDTVNIIAP